MTPHDILTFWFEESNPDQWFEKVEAFDQEIRTRFLATHERVVRGETLEWRDTPEGKLAEVIVLDQFSRNMFRGTPRAFAYDALALARAQEAIANGDDMRVPPLQRQFFYMPLMHSELLAVHTESRSLFEALGNESLLKYETEHTDIIERFGRYPHRNKVLGRASTPEEEAFLEHHEGF